jgi:hypothetical protein
MSFAWADDGDFLVQRTDAGPPGDDMPEEWLKNAPFPTTSIIGYDDGDGIFSMLYSDARGVYRVYRMSIDGGLWRIWRRAEGFHQRFSGTFSRDGNTITAGWDRSTDGRDLDP